jgi:hypothetical protein
MKASRHATRGRIGELAPCSPWRSRPACVLLGQVAAGEPEDDRDAGPLEIFRRWQAQRAPAPEPEEP